MEKHRVYRLLLAACAASALLGSTVTAWREAPRFAEVSTYKRVEWWLLSARCTQWRKTFLTACGQDGKLYPIEDVSPTDDRGHALLLNALALLKTTPLTRSDVVRVNICLNATGVLLVSGMLAIFQMPIAAALSAIAGASLIPRSVALGGADVPAAFLGIFCLALLPGLWLALVGSLEFKRSRQWYVVLGLWTVLAGALMLREAMGLIGVMMALILVGIRYWQVRRQATACLRLASLLALTVGAVYSTSFFLFLRNYLYNVPKPILISSHGIAHALHQGLGTEPNPWGIAYPDESGYETVRKINPEAGFGTPSYFREIRKRYIHIVCTSPGAVLRIYAIKFKRTLGLPLQWLGFPILTLLFPIAIVMGGLFREYGIELIQLRALLAIFLYVGLFLMQGVLILPEARILHPAKFGVLLLLSVLADVVLQSIFSGFSNGAKGGQYSGWCVARSEIKLIAA